MSIKLEHGKASPSMSLILQNNAETLLSNLAFSSQTIETIRLLFNTGPFPTTRHNCGYPFQFPSKILQSSRRTSTLQSMGSLRDTLSIFINHLGRLHYHVCNTFLSSLLSTSLDKDPLDEWHSNHGRLKDLVIYFPVYSPTSSSIGNQWHSIAHQRTFQLL